MLLPSRVRIFGPPAHRSLGAALVVAAVVSGACLPTLPVNNTPTTSSTQAVQTSSSTIRIGKVIRGDLTGVLNFTAPVQNKGDVLVVSRVSARLDKLDVDIGSPGRGGGL